MIPDFAPDSADAFDQASVKVVVSAPNGETLAEPASDDPEGATLELDELWSFVGSKTQPCWLWLSLDSEFCSPNFLMLV